MKNIESNKIIYILLTAIFIWLLLLTSRSGEYIVSPGDGGGAYIVSPGDGGGAYLVNSKTGEAWWLLGREKRKVKED